MDTFSVRLLAKFEIPVRISNKTCLIYDQLTNIASGGEIFSRNLCTVLYKSWEHKACCLLISLILAGIKAVFSTKEFAKGDLV